MATRMQQRRGTATQWSTADPILNAGEIGYESDTNKFKIGDGINHWADLDYFVDEAALGTSLGDYVETADLGVANGVATLDANSKLTSSQLPDVAQVTVHAVANQAARLALSVQVGDIAIQSDNGQTYVLSATPASTDGNWTAITVADPFPTHDTDDLAEGTTNKYFTDERAQDAVGNAIGTGLSYNDSTGAISVTTNTYDAYGSASTVAGNLSTHESDTSTHGVTGNIVGTSDTQTLTNKTLTSPKINEDVVLTTTATELNYVDGVTSSIQTQLNNLGTDKADIASPTFTGTVTTDDLVVNGDFTVNGTNFAASATTIVIEDNLVQLAHENAANTVDLGIVVGYTESSTTKHSGIVRDVSADKWKLFKGVTTEPTTTVDFTQGSLDDLEVAGFTASSITVGDVSNTEFGYLNGVTSGIQNQLDDKAPLASPTFTGTVSGITSTMVGLGNVENTALSTWAGSSNITTLGTITTGTWNGTTIAIANGGTGQTTAMAAATALLPDQTNNSGKYLTNDGSGTLSWATVSGYSAPTLGSTSIASGATVTTIAGLTLSNATLTGTLTAGGSAGTAGYVLKSTGSGVEWAEASSAGADEVMVLMGAL